MNNAATSPIATAVALVMVVALTGCYARPDEIMRQHASATPPPLALPPPDPAPQPQAGPEDRPEDPPSYIRLPDPAQPSQQQRQTVPEPLDRLLPGEITIHPFTGARTVDQAGKPLGFEVRIKVLDSYGDPTKAFGELLFMLYDYKAQSENPRGNRLGTWPEHLMDPEKNQLHWDPISQSYKFNLRYNKQLSVGHRYVLEVYFTSPFTERLTAMRDFTADQ